MAGERTFGKDARVGMEIGNLQVSVTAGPDRGRTFSATNGAPVSVGTAKDNDLVLSDRTVSRYHLEVTAMPDGFRLEDLGSRNGTFVSGLRVERARAPAGTAIDIGDTTCLVSDADRKIIAPERLDAAIPDFVAESPAMTQLVSDVHRLAPTTVSVLIQGETGTGKELVARAVHDLGARANEPFIVVDCGSMPATLIASELFGHERGAFTGADRQRRGAFELAHGGTLFLDEIGELPIEVQPALLGALERRRFRRVGGETPIDVDVRVISATHRDLRAEVNHDGFRADLYFRLAVARLRIPPLRDRPEDIQALVEKFAAEIDGGLEAPFGPDAIRALMAHRWTGNVRELRNVVEAALALGRLRLEETVRERADETTADSDGGDPPTYKEARAAVLEEFERRYLAEIMRRCDGNASEAARRARMARPYLLRLLKRHDLR